MALAGIRLHARDEMTVDLEIVDRVVAEQLQAVVADAEIVDGELEAGKAQFPHKEGEFRQGVVVEALGDLEADRGGRDAGAGKMPARRSTRSAPSGTRRESRLTKSVRERKSGSAAKAAMARLLTMCSSASNCPASCARSIRSSGERKPRRSKPRISDS
ncbi:hypothetical protein GCM10023069_00050 [Shinella granuli]